MQIEAINETHKIERKAQKGGGFDSEMDKANQLHVELER